MDTVGQPSTHLIYLLAAAIILIVLSLLFSASESAFLSVNKLRVRFLRDNKDKKAERVGRLLDKKEELLNTLLIGNNIVNIMLSAILTAASLHIFGSKGVGIATGVVTLILLVFGEITPKTIATKHPERVAFALSGFISVVFKILKPVVFVFTTISRSILKIFGVDTKKKNVSFTEDEIKTLFEVGSEEGIIQEHENAMMNRVFKFTDLSAVEIMIPRRNIVPITLDMTYDEIVRLSFETNFSKFPVLKEKENLDTIIGFLYLKDLLHFASESEKFSVRSAMRPPLFIPGTTTTSSIRHILRSNHQSMAVVIDEYSGTDGILTSEDIAREIFGTTRKNDDAQKSLKDFESIFSFVKGNEIIDGAMRLSDFEERFHIALESRLNETVAGYILEKLDRIAENGDVIRENGLKFTVKEMEGLRISKVLIEQDSETPENAKEDL